MLFTIFSSLAVVIRSPDQQTFQLFFRIIAANIAHPKDVSPLLPFVEDASSIPSDDIIDEHLLTVFVTSFKNDLLG